MTMPAFNMQYGHNPAILHTAATSVSLRDENIESLSQTVTQQPQLPLWVDHFRKRIYEFNLVQSKIGSVNGVFLSIEMIYKAAFLLLTIATTITEAPLISLLDDGALHFEWENDSHFLTVTLAPNSELDFYYESEEKIIEPAENRAKNISTLKTLLNNFSS